MIVAACTRSLEAEHATVWLHQGTELHAVADVRGRRHQPLRLAVAPPLLLRSAPLT